MYNGVQDILCCVCVLFSLFCVPYVASISGWSNFDCPVDVLNQFQVNEGNPFTEITVVMYTCTIKSQYEGHSKIARVPENVPAMNSFHLFIGYNYVQYLLLMWKIRLPFIDSVLLYIGAL